MATISSFVGDDHDKLDETLERAHREAGADEAKALFSRFVDGPKAHISWEEDILFPVFEEKSGLGDSGPTVVMRMEHRTTGRTTEFDASRWLRTDAPAEGAGPDLACLLGSDPPERLFPTMRRSRCGRLREERSI